MAEQQIPLVKIVNASVFIPGDKARRRVLQNINLCVWPGEHLAITGPNGAGKSTLLRFLHGELVPCAGSIAWSEGQRLSESRITGQEISGLVSPHMQTHCQLFLQGLTALEFLQRDSAVASRDNIETLLTALESAHILPLAIGHLSQGQLRLLLLCREILRQPPLLLLDEWTEGLDQRRRNLLNALLPSSLSDTTMIFASPRGSDVPDFARMHLCLQAATLTDRPPAPKKQAAQSRIIAASTTASEIIFQLQNVSVYVDREEVLHHINWTVRQGEHWRIVGDNGAGKSTLLRLLAGGEFAASGGSLRHFSPYLAREIVTMGERKRSAVLISDLSQALYSYAVTPLELVLSGADMNEGMHHEYPKAEIERAAELLALFFPEKNLAPGINIRQLSSGQLRRLFLARALMGNADVLLLDEPCTGLDGPSRAAYVDMIDRLISGAVPGYKPQLILVAHDDADFTHLPFKIARMNSGMLHVEL